ncbi:response regulator [Guptibacillus hwajinpoensis]|uniref:LuxR family transcriptional regulator n=1 Tax=Guptibacillus hwajinpoensis TaxID=208199 RepID=A0A0J6FYK4_9BACL|nr:response regulator transcription factor [Alkalihalobacillus macyae]KMM39457.1 LuxR family transcriptional regulator [Alkalihalobacillus macyae]
MINVMLVDDHAVLRDGLKNILEMEEDIKVVGEAVNGNEVVRVVTSCQPDVVLMDINIPDKNGIELTGMLKRDYPSVKVLVLTMHSHDEYFMAAIREGADGYLLKDLPTDQVVEAIRTVAKGESIIDPTLTKRLLGFYNQKQEASSTSELTDREKEVLICLVSGKSNKEIGEELYISDKTVKIHVSKIYKKLNVKSRSQAIIYAVQHQLVPLP